MPRHARPTLSTELSSSPQVHFLHLQQQQQHHHHQSPAYGLLEPSVSPVECSGGSPPSAPLRSTGVRRGSGGAAVAPLPPYAQATRRHYLRKHSTLGKSLGIVVPAWSEVEAGFDDLRDFGFEFGANIGILGDKLSQTVPGVKGSVAFLSTLRSNIQLSTALGPPSPYLHPPVSLSPFSSTSKLVVPPSSPASTFDSNLEDFVMPPDSIGTTTPPELVYETPKTPKARIEALQLIADSVAQKRQHVASKMLTSFSSLAFMLAVEGLVFFFIYNNSSDLSLVATTSILFLMTYLLLVRWLVAGYITQAESINWAWLGDDELLIARFGSDTIGAVAFRIVQESRSSAGSAMAPSTAISVTKGGPDSPRATNRRAGRRRSSTSRTGIVRAWTVGRRHRGHGVGKALLETVVRVCVKDRRCSTVAFASESERAGASGVLGPLLASLTGVEKMLNGEVDLAGQALKEAMSTV